MELLEVRTGMDLLKRAYDRALEPVCGRHGLTRMEMDVLLFLANNPEMDTASALVSVRRLPKSHVSAAVNALAERGLIQREYRGGNREKAHLCPTAAADAPIADGRAVQREFGRTLTEGIAPEELEQMLRTARRMVENIRREL